MSADVREKVAEIVAAIRRDTVEPSADEHWADAIFAALPTEPTREPEQGEDERLAKVERTAFGDGFRAAEERYGKSRASQEAIDEVWKQSISFDMLDVHADFIRTPSDSEGSTEQARMDQDVPTGGNARHDSLRSSSQEGDAGEAPRCQKCGFALADVGLPRFAVRYRGETLGGDLPVGEMMQRGWIPTRDPADPATPAIVLDDLTAFFDHDVELVALNAHSQPEQERASTPSTGDEQA